MTYAIVKTGGKQYRVEQGQSLLVERLPEDDGAKVKLEPLLFVDGDTVLDGAGFPAATPPPEVPGSASTSEATAAVRPASSILTRCFSPTYGVPPTTEIR